MLCVASYCLLVKGEKVTHEWSLLLSVSSISSLPHCSLLTIWFILCVTWLGSGAQMFGQTPV